MEVTSTEGSYASRPARADDGWMIPGPYILSLLHAYVFRPWRESCGLYWSGSRTWTIWMISNRLFHACAPQPLHLEWQLMNTYNWCYRTQLRKMLILPAQQSLWPVEAWQQSRAPLSVYKFTMTNMFLHWTLQSNYNVQLKSKFKLDFKILSYYYILYLNYFYLYTLSFILILSLSFIKFIICFFVKLKWKLKSNGSAFFFLNFKRWVPFFSNSRCYPGLGSRLEWVKS